MTAPSPRVWLITCVSLIFLIGASAGVLVDRFLLRPPPRPGDMRHEPGGPMRGGPPPGQPMGPPPPGPPPIDRLLQDLDHTLHLTTDQRERITGILNARLPHLRDLQAEARDRFNAEQQSLHTDISAVLTPDQIKAFDEMAPIADPGRGGPRHGGPGRPGDGRRGGH